MDILAKDITVPVSIGDVVLDDGITDLTVAVSIDDVALSVWLPAPASLTVAVSIGEPAGASTLRVDSLVTAVAMDAVTLVPVVDIEEINALSVAVSIGEPEAYVAHAIDVDGLSVAVEVGEPLVNETASLGTEDLLVSVVLGEPDITEEDARPRYPSGYSVVTARSPLVGLEASLV